MRIRKRRVPLPLSSLSPVPLSSLSLSDLCGSGSGSSLIPPVQLILRPAAPAATDDIDNSSKPPDQAATNWRSIGRHDAVDHPELGINGDQEKLISNDSCVSTTSRIASQSAQAHLPSILGRVAGGKKGRNRDDNEEEEVVEGEEDNKSVGTADSKSKGAASPSGGARKRGRGAGGGTVMEGSRCSRMNGRGWRCCQPTLVGYSLCEHHLGKGRLRSMTSMRRTRPGTAPGPRSSQEAKEQKDEEDENYVDQKIKNKKGMRLKARSMSSLLRQDDNSNADSSGATPVTAGMPEAMGSDSKVKECSDEAA